MWANLYACGGVAQFLQKQSNNDKDILTAVGALFHILVGSQEDDNDCRLPKGISKEGVVGQIL